MLEIKQITDEVQRCDNCRLLYEKTFEIWAGGGIKHLTLCPNCIEELDNKFKYKLFLKGGTYK